MTTTPITLRSDFDVELVQTAGSDEMICKAARVSTLGSGSINSSESSGLINFLMKNRHGSPFEHGLLTFRIEAPIFVWREHMRHRIASYNEQSGRYMEMRPVFYIPPPERPMQQIGKAGKYEFVQGSADQYDRFIDRSIRSKQVAWDAYQESLADGVAKEVARIDLPLSIYSSAYVTMNPRGLMNFVSLRTKDGSSMFPSYPQWEIEQVARYMESFFQQEFPNTFEAFDANGRVCP